MKTSRIPREQWRRQVRAWKASGLSSRKYATKAGINANTLVWWRWRLAKESSPADRQRRSRPVVELVELPQLQPSEPIGSTPGIARLELEVAGIVVRLPGNFEPESLTRLLQVLEARR